MQERPPFPPALGVAVAVLSVSFAAPLFTLANAPAVTASFWRLALACLLLLPFAGSAWRKWGAYTGREWGWLALAGVALGAHFALWVTSLGMTSVAASTALVTLQAVFVAVGGHFLLGDRLGPLQSLGVGTAVAGALVIAFGDASLSESIGDASLGALWGDLLALAAGIGSAIYLLIGRRLRARRGLVEYVLPVYGFAALALLVALPLVGQPLFAAGDPLDCLAWLGPWGTFAVFVLLAAVPMLGGHTMANWSMRYVPAHVVATWILLEPVGAALLAWGISCIGQVPSAWTVAGGALVLVGASLTVPRKGGGSEAGAASPGAPP